MGRWGVQVQCEGRGEWVLMPRMSRRWGCPVVEGEGQGDGRLLTEEEGGGKESCHVRNVTRGDRLVHLEDGSGFHGGGHGREKRERDESMAAANGLAAPVSPNASRHRVGEGGATSLVGYPWHSWREE